MSADAPDASPRHDPLAGGGETGAAMRTVDWTATAVGPVDAWPPALRTTLGIVLAAPCPMALAWGPDLTFFCNDAFRPILGRHRPAALGQPASIAFAGRWHDLGPLFADVMTGGSPRVDDRAGCTYIPVGDERGRVGGVLVTAAAIAGSIVDARTRLYAEFMQAPVAVSVVVGPDFVYDLANPRYEAMVGRTGITGKSMAAAFPELPANADVYQLLRRVYRDGAPFTAAEYRIAVGDIERFFNFTLQPIRDEHGGITGIMSVAMDVSEGVRLRRDAEAARAEAEVANRAKDEFLAMLGHELRNPLAPIRTALQLMRMRDETALRRERTILERQVDHLVRLVDDLLDISRITRGKIELKREHIEIGVVVTRAIEIVRPMIDQRALKLTVAVAQTGLRVDGDPVRLAQILSNLLHNAAKYAEPAGDVSIVAAREDRHVVVRVCDDGIGVNPEILPRLFDLFVQARQASDRAQGGLGLGLAIARNLVELHGGTIAARSDGPGTGAEFIVRLPLAGLPPRTAGDRPEPPANPGPSARILVVDDNADAAELMAEALRMLGHHVEVAGDGTAALALAARFQPTLALLDIGLPGMDGHELAARLRRLAIAPIHLVAVTGYGQTADRRRSLDAGFDDHLVKPIELDALARHIERLVG